MSTPIREIDIGRGVDQLHPESKLSPGYALDILNGIARSTGSLVKRKGYRRVGGFTPIRITSYEQLVATGQITLTVDDSYDLTTAPLSNIILSGRTTAVDGDFPVSAETSLSYMPTVVDAVTFTVQAYNVPASDISSNNIDMVVYGWDPATVEAATAEDRFSWVTLLSSYISPSRSTPITSVAGVPHRLRTTDEINAVNAGMAPTHEGSYFFSFSAVDRFRGPALFDVAPLDIPYRGVIIAGNAGMNRCPIVAAEYVDDGGPYDSYTKYRVYAPTYGLIPGAGSPPGLVSDIIRPDIDWLTVRQSAWEALNGEFLVKAVVDDPLSDGNHFDVYVDNEANAELDQRKSDDSMQGEAGVFTDLLDTAEQHKFPPGSIIRATDDTIDEAALSPYLSTGTDYVVAGPFDSVLNFNNLTIAAEMTAQVIPYTPALLDPTPIVRGDEIFCSADGRPRRVINTVVPTGAEFTATGDGIETTLNAPAYLPGTWMRVGDLYRFYGHPDLTGEFEIIEIVDDDNVKVSSSFSGTTAANAITVERYAFSLDEPVTFVNAGPDDADAFTVLQRWYPLRPFYDSTSQFQPTNPMPVRQFEEEDPDDQSYAAAASVTKSLYMTNYSDPVKKYDGTEIYNAGIPPVPSLLFLTRNRKSSGIFNPNRTISYTSKTGNFQLNVAAGDEGAFEVGDRVCVYSNNAGVDIETFTYVESVASTIIRLTNSVQLQNATGSIVKSVALKYYLKYRLVDNQGQFTYSAGMKSQDLTVEFGPTTEIQGCISAFPPIGNFPYSRMEYEIYRTSGTTGEPPYYLVNSGTYTFTSYSPYINFTDAVQIDQLSDFTGTVIGTPDPNSALTGGNSSGPDFDRPPLAKYAASLDSRLALGNIKGPNRMEIVLRRKPDRAIQSSPSLRGYFTFCRGNTIPTNPGDGGTDQLSCVITSQQATIWQIGSLVQFDDYFEVTLSAGSSPEAGTWVYLFTPAYAGQLDTTVGATYAGWWMVSEWVSATSFRVLRSGFSSLASTAGASSTITVADGTADLRTGQPAYLTGTTSGTLTVNATHYIRVLNSTQINLCLTATDAFSNTGTLTSAALANWTLHVGDYDLHPESLTIGAGNSVVPMYFEPDSSSSYDLNYDVLGGVPRQADQSLENFIARRLADAINASQAATVPGVYTHHITGSVLADYTGFTPFIYARAGNDVGYAKVIVESLDPNQVFNFAYTPQFSPADFDVFVNGRLYDRGGAALSNIAAPVYSQQRSYPSRVVVSYPNYPEIFDAPYALDSLSSDSVIDVSPDDGQEITGIIPFFGTSFSSSAQQGQKLVVFKDRSVYIVDVRTKQVDFVESHGQGCGWPRTVSDTNQGIMFANDSGIYCLRRDNRVQYIGQMAERLWKQRLASDASEDIPCAVNDVYDQLWSVSIPIVDSDDEAVNSETLTYDYTREEAGETGSWQRNDGIPGEASAHTSYLFDSLVGGYNGQIYIERTSGTETDYRDDTDAINFRARLRAMSFDAPSIRKRLLGFVIAFRTLMSTSGTQVRSSIDLTNQYTDCDTFELTRPESTTGIGDVEQLQVSSIWFTPQQHKFEYISVEIQNEALDEGVEVADITYSVETLGTQGIAQANEPARR